MLEDLVEADQSVDGIFDTCSEPHVLFSSMDLFWIFPILIINNFMVVTSLVKGGVMDIG